MVVQTITERGIISKYNNIVFNDSVNTTANLVTHGLATASTLNTITLESGSNNAYNNLVIEIVNGCGKNQYRLITAFTSLVATVEPNWDILPDDTSKYIIHPHSGKCQMQDICNLSDYIKLSSTEQSIDEFHTRAFIKIVHGQGKGQTAEILSYDGTDKVINIQPTFSTLVADDSLYIIYGESGLAASGTTNTIVLDGNQTDCVKALLYIEIYKGTGIGQIRMISSISTNTVTVSENWDVIPNSTSRYTIFAGWAPKYYESVIKYATATVSSTINYHDGQSMLMTVSMAMDINGVNSLNLMSELSLNKPATSHSFTITSEYFRLKVINMSYKLDGAVQTICNSYKDGKVTTFIEENITEGNDCELTRSVMTGRTTAGNYKNVSVNYEGQLETSIRGPLDAFGSLATTQPEQFIELMFLNNFVNPVLTSVYSQNGGTSTSVNNVLNVASGTNVLGRSILYSKRRIRYTPGLGLMIRFSAFFSTPIANSNQLIGIGDQNNGIFIGYNNTNFGILHRRGGKSEIRKLTITQTSTANDTITITMNGDTSAGIAILSTDSTAQIARKIAQTSFVALGNGWTTFEDNNMVTFISLTSGAKSGTYSYNIGTSDSIGSFATTCTGVAVIDTWIRQENWNRDRGLGVQELPYINFQKGNVFQLDFQWLGFGDIGINIENPNTGTFVLLHTIKYANMNTVVSLENPNLPLCVSVSKTANDATDLKVCSGSMGVYTMGKINPILGARFGVSHSYCTTSGQLTGGTAYNLLAIRNHVVFNGLTNTSEKYALTISLSLNCGADILRGGAFLFVANPNLDNTNGLTWTDRITGVSSVSYCKDVVTYTGGSELISHVMGPKGEYLNFISQVEFYIPPGVTMSFVFKPLVNLLTTPNTSIADIAVSCVWIER